MQIARSATDHQRHEVYPDDVRGESPQPATKGVAHGLERHAVLPVPLRGTPVEIATLPRIGQLRPQQVRDEPVELVPAPRPTHRVHEEVRRLELGEASCAVVAAGDCVGKVGTDEVEYADLAEQVPGRWRGTAEHLGEQVPGDAVVVAGEGGDAPGGIAVFRQLEGGQAEGGRPALGASYELSEDVGFQLDPRGRQHRAGLVGAERELLGTHLAQRPGEPERVEGPRWILAARGDDPQPLRWPFDQAEQTFVHGGGPELVQVVEDQEHRPGAHQSCSDAAGKFADIHGVDVTQRRGRRFPHCAGESGGDGRPESCADRRPCPPD